jgi:hypothetical protein
MSSNQKIKKDAIRVAREVVKRGFWNGHEALTEASAVEITRDGTLWLADLKGLKEIVGRRLTKADHWLWETTLRDEIIRFAPVV